ncbi:hypothetical protein FQN55_002222 [Onygenales sp. PD_40]|nr:hypothetical protein FQN55_002222 [Onygenales sp. PD_40]
MSPVARYVTKVLYEIYEVAQEKVALFVPGPNAAWLMSMLSADWGTESIWLQGGMSQEERDVIISTNAERNPGTFPIKPFNLAGPSVVMMVWRQDGGPELNLAEQLP